MDVAKTPAVLTDCVFDYLLKSTEHTPQQVEVKILFLYINYVILITGF